MRWLETPWRLRERVLDMMHVTRRDIARRVGFEWSEEFLVAFEAAISELEEPIAESVRTLPDAP